MLSFSYFLTKKARKIRMKQGNSKLIASSKGGTGAIKTFIFGVG